MKIQYKEPKCFFVALDNDIIATSGEEDGIMGMGGTAYGECEGEARSRVNPIWDD